MKILDQFWDMETDQYRIVQHDDGRIALQHDQLEGLEGSPVWVDVSHHHRYRFEVVLHRLVTLLKGKA